MSASYPNGIFSWATVFDGQSVDYAEGDNSIAADLIAVEMTLGTNPQIEPSPAAGGAAVTYATVSDRLTAIQRGEQLPAAQLSSSLLIVNNQQGPGTNYGVWNTYAANYDPYNCYNGNDITIPTTGYWRITAGQQWDWWSTGYCLMALYVNNTVSDTDIWHWDFTGNSRPGAWQSPVPGLPGPVLRPGSTRVTWEGQIPAGQRVRVLSENGTSDAQHAARNLWLGASMLRTT